MFSRTGLLWKNAVRSGLPHMVREANYARVRDYPFIKQKETDCSRETKALLTALQMMPGGMMPSGWDWGSMWLVMVIPAVAIVAGILLVVLLVLRNERQPSLTQGANYSHTQTQPTSPGQTTSFKFKATREGLYVYHCATPPVDHHVANGMYGLILVEDPANLLPVGAGVKEFYVVQGEFYTKGAKGQAGHHDFHPSEMLSENPDYVVFNGKVGSLVGTGNALTANVNDKVRIYFGVGGPNIVSSFHIIGEIFDTVYPEGSMKPGTALTNVQTTLVPGGGSTIVEFTPEVIGSGYWLVDHSLTRAIQKGALGQLIVSGTSIPGIYGFP